MEVGVIDCSINHGDSAAVVQRPSKRKRECEKNRDGKDGGKLEADGMWQAMGPYDRSAGSRVDRRKKDPWAAHR